MVYTFNGRRNEVLRINLEKMLTESSQTKIKKITYCTTAIV